MATGGVACHGKAGIPAIFPMIKPSAGVMVCEKYVDEGVVRVAERKHQQTAMEGWHNGQCNQQRGINTF